MSRLVESESLVTQSSAQPQPSMLRGVAPRKVIGRRIKPVIPFWQAAVLAALSLWLYGPTIYHLVQQWAAPDSDFSHGFFVPLFSVFALWQERRRLSEIIPKPSWSGLAVIAFALCVLIIGRLGAELFFARVSMLFLIAGLVVLFAGWNFFRAVFFPWAFLLFMIPIPTLLYNQITFPLQLLASRVAADVLQLLNVPVFREGNVITLPNIVLEVAKACSGIRSLMSLTCLAIIYGYLMERRIAVRWALALISLPIAVAANSARIIGTGLMAHYWDPKKAEGFYHVFEGWLIFVVSLVLLYLAHLLIQVIWPDRGVAPGDSRRSSAAGVRDYLTSWPRFLFALVLFACAVFYLKEHDLSEVFPPHQPIESFPRQLGSWNGTDLVIDQETRDVLGPGEFLSRSYSPSADQGPSNELLIAYFPSQRTGDTIHSPMHCLPGSGWLPLERSQVTLSLGGHAPFPANRVVIAKGEVWQVVLYWYWAHDRGVASEYSAKYYLIKDSIQMHRSDGALVRIITPIYPGEDADAAYRRILPFAGEIVPRLDDYIPR